MAAVAILFALAFLGLRTSVVLCSGTFYQKVSGSEDGAAPPTKWFHQCSLKNQCNYVGIPLYDAGNKVYSAGTMEELQITGQKMHIWKKVQLDGPKDKIKEFKSCKEAMKAGLKKNGKVKLELGKNQRKEVFCDMLTDGGGWLVFQRRLNGTTNFQRNWQSYEEGFGELDGNFWLGLKYLHNFTSQGKWTLRIDLESTGGQEGFAKYTGFKIGSSEDKYKLRYEAFSGSWGDALAYHQGMKFSTYDQDNDRYSGNCAAEHKGGWWYKACLNSNLNNLYPGSSSKSNEMMSWKTWKTTYGDIYFSEMKMKMDD